MFVKLRGKKINIYTLGCKVNQYESDSMADALKDVGAQIVTGNEPADVCIINTCSVTNMADRKSRQIIHRAKKLNPNAVIVAAGCYVQAAKESLESDSKIDIVIGNNRKKDIVRLLEEYFQKGVVNDYYIDINKGCEYENMTLVKPTEHTRAYVKVQDGCNNFCSYCIIPYTRGRIRSRELREVIEEISGLASRGIKEVVITGINLSSYSDGEGHSLLELLKAVSDIDGICRIRMGSLEPRIITEEFLEGIYQDEKICPHFHLSLQSACNETLKRMNRKYTIEEYMEKCELIRSYYDRPAITTDVIVGFPGETEEEFAITKSNLEKLKLFEMHIFKYSIRKGTVAATMPNQVPDSIKEQRSNILLEMADSNSKEFQESFIGEELKVLVEEYEETDEGCFAKGHTDRYIMVRKQMDKTQCEVSINCLVDIVY
ncbi:MAG: tRNA (N(6)-L-threonylcarbamoyladenosine(37)-C(2))-methylthiotransferase MtaB [Lachnospiraceae bacterium]|nr:tRNA (N(6)-L-threonylcarbamoyladenosine(37)-C(2))-methylthiotransferase MtaB [Lachnospiraceae bacterium]